MPDFLPVCQQNFLQRCQSAVRTEQKQERIGPKTACGAAQRRISWNAAFPFILECSYFLMYERTAS